MVTLKKVPRIALFILFTLHVCQQYEAATNSSDQYDWIDPLECLRPIISDYEPCHKGKSSPDCILSFRNNNGSKKSSTSNLISCWDDLYKCQPFEDFDTCPNNASTNKLFGALNDCVPSKSVIRLKAKENHVIKLNYAAIWKCDDSNFIQCPTHDPMSVPSSNTNCALKLLPGVFSLVKFWCQNKPSCQFDLRTIMTFVESTKELKQPEDIEPSIFEWNKDDVEIGALKCGPDQVASGDSCYMVTKPGLSWMEARSECFKAGGDLARFSGTNGADFYGIVRQLDPESSSIIQINDPKAYPVWFKWYTWTGEQRNVQQFAEVVGGFYCPIVHPDILEKENPLARCSGNELKIAQKSTIRGLCVLPPEVDAKKSMNEKDGRLFSTCPAGCIAYYDTTEYPNNIMKDDASSEETCPAGFKGNVYTSCY